MDNILTLTFGWPRGLYAPENRQGSCEAIARSDGVGVFCVATGYARKYLSLAIVFRHLSTNGACQGSVRGRVLHQENTVLLGNMRRPRKNSPVHPRCHSLTKLFTSIPPLASFQILEVLQSKNPHCIPRQRLQRAIEVMVALSQCPSHRPASTFPASNFVADLLKLVAVEAPIGIGQCVGHALVYSQNRAGLLAWKVGDDHPQDNAVLGERAALHKLCEWPLQPFARHRCVLCQYSNRMPLAKCGKPNTKVETFTSGRDRDKLCVKERCTIEYRATATIPRGGRCLARSTNYIQCLFEGRAFVSRRKTRPIEPGQRGLVQPAAFMPQRADVEIDSTAIGFQQRRNRLTLPASGKLQCYFTGASHKIFQVAAPQTMQSE